VSLIRHRQPAITRLFPHQGNRRFLVPNRAFAVGGPGPAPPEGGDLDDELALFELGCNPSQFDGWLCQESGTINPGAEIGHRAIVNGQTASALLHDGQPTPVGDKTLLVWCAYLDPTTGTDGAPWSLQFHGWPLTPVPSFPGGLGTFMIYGPPGGATVSSLRLSGTNAVVDSRFGYFNTFDGDRRAEFFAAYGAMDLTP
jgi:hypothetical protein